MPISLTSTAGKYLFRQCSNGERVLVFATNVKVEVLRELLCTYLFALSVMKIPTYEYINSQAHINMQTVTPETYFRDVVLKSETCSAWQASVALAHPFSSTFWKGPGEERQPVAPSRSVASRQASGNIPRSALGPEIVARHTKMP